MPGFELIGQEERDAVAEVFDDGGILFAHGWDATRKGRFRVREFERAFAARIGVRYAQAVNTGTAALKVGLVALGVKPGDEVITQAFTFIATVEAIVAAGAVPRIVNVDDTLNLDPAELEAAITPRTKAIVPVHMLGVAANVDQILAVARARGVRVLDDNCESIGATWGDEMLGVQADACAWSFDFGKTITTGEGGMITTNDEAVFKLAREYHDHGHEGNPQFPRGRDTHRVAGFNYRMTELQAAVGLAQLPKLDRIVKRNREVCAIFADALTGIDGIRFRAIPAGSRSLSDCLMFELPSADLAKRFVAKMTEARLGTKNVPDAIEWHFAGYWDHIFGQYGMDKDALWTCTLPSWRRLERSVAVPVMVNYSDGRVREIADQLRSIAEGVLSPAPRSTKITSKDYHDYHIRDGRFIGEFEQMYQNVPDPWGCAAKADSLKNDLLLATVGGLRVTTHEALDIGCGLGALTARLRDTLPSARWHACDVSPTAVQQAEANVRDVHFLVHDLAKDRLPFADESLDLVTMAEVMWCVLPHLSRVFQDVRRVLRPGGHFLMLQYFLTREEQQYGRDIVSEPSDLLRYLRGAGLRVVDEVYLSAEHPLVLLACCVRPESSDGKAASAPSAHTNRDR